MFTSLLPVRGVLPRPRGGYSPPAGSAVPFVSGSARPLAECSCRVSRGVISVNVTPVTPSHTNGYGTQVVSHLSGSRRKTAGRCGRFAGRFEEIYVVEFGNLISRAQANLLSGSASTDLPRTGRREWTPPESNLKVTRICGALRQSGEGAFAGRINVRGRQFESTCPRRFLIE
jgi:hypothetical protein